MATPTPSALRSIVGQMNLKQTTSVSAVRGLRKLQGALTETDQAVQDVIGAIVDELDSVSDSGGGAGGFDQYDALRAMDFDDDSEVAPVGAPGGDDIINFGGGLFRKNHTGILSPEGLNDNGGTWFKPDSRSNGSQGRWERVIDGEVNAAWFGLAGDRAIDDYPRLQAAIDFARAAGLPLFIPTPPILYPLWEGSGHVYAALATVMAPNGLYYRTTAGGTQTGVIAPTSWVSQTIGGVAWTMVGGQGYRIETGLTWHDATSRQFSNGFSQGPRIRGAGRNATIIDNQSGGPAFSVNGASVSQHKFFDGGKIQDLCIDSIPTNSGTIGVEIRSWWHGTIEEVFVRNQGAHGFRINQQPSGAVDGDSTVYQTFRKCAAYQCGRDYGTLITADEITGGAHAGVPYGWGFYVNTIDTAVSLGRLLFDGCIAYECMGGGYFIKGAIQTRFKSSSAFGNGSAATQLTNGIVTNDGWYGAPNGRTALPVSAEAAGIRIACPASGSGMCRGLEIDGGEFQGNANHTIRIDGLIMGELENLRIQSDELVGWWCFPHAHIQVGHKDIATLGVTECVQILSSKVRVLWEKPDYALWLTGQNYSSGTIVSNQYGEYFRRDGADGTGNTEPDTATGTFDSVLWTKIGAMDAQYLAPYWKTGHTYDANDRCTNNSTFLYYRNIGSSGAAAAEPAHTYPAWVSGTTYRSGDVVTSTAGHWYTRNSSASTTTSNPTHSSGTTNGWVYGGTNIDGTIIWAFEGPGGHTVTGSQRGLQHIHIEAVARGTTILPPMYQEWVSPAAEVVSIIHDKLKIETNARGIRYSTNDGNVIDAPANTGDETAQSETTGDFSATSGAASYTPDNLRFKRHRIQLGASVTSLVINAPVEIDTHSPIEIEIINSTGSPAVTMNSVFYPNGWHSFTMAPSTSRYATFTPSGTFWVLEAPWSNSHLPNDGRSSIAINEGDPKDIGLTEANRRVLDFSAGTDVGTDTLAYVPVGHNKWHLVHNHKTKGPLKLRAGTEASPGATTTIGRVMAQATRLAWSDGTNWYTQTTPETKDDFFQNTVAASQTAASVERESSTAGAAFPNTWLPLRHGHITGVFVKSDDACTAGTCTIEVYKNGTGTGLTAVLNSTTATQYAVAVQATELDMFAPGDEIELRITTSGTWAPVTANIRCGIEVQY